MNNLMVALQITALGMGLVFGAIILLWWMMNLLTVLTAEKEPESASAKSVSGATATAIVDDELKAQAVAVAVAMAFAEQRDSIPHVLTEPPPAIVSAWQLGMRTRQMYQKGNSIKHRGR
jgi:Na+-transporting methylmalonyl-CoA/oxaloacetate decarboxylase gamma subunit